MLFLCLADNGHAGVNLWTDRGPGIAEITRLTATATSQAMFAGVGNRTFRSTNRGDSWELLYALERSGNVRVICDPRDPNLLYAVNGISISRSTDKGDTWKVLGQGFSALAGFGVDPVKPRVFYAWFAGQRIARSTDEGLTWTTILTDDSYFQSFSIDQKVPGRLFAATGERLLISEDRGESWREIEVPVPIREMVSFASDPKRLYALGETEVLRSTDGGYSWKGLDLDSGSSVYDLAARPGSTDELYLARGWHLFRSTDGGDSWTQTPFPFSVKSLLFDSDDRGLLYAGTGSGLFGVRVDVDGWLSVSAGFEGLRGGQVNAVALDPTREGRVYAAGGQGFHISTDSGVSWRSSNTGLDEPIAIEAIEVDPRNPSVLFLASSWVYRSTDSGQSWQKVAGINSIHDIQVDPRDSNVVYAAYGYIPWTFFVSKPLPKTQYGPQGAVYKSTDGGATWAIPSSQVKDLYVSSLAIDPADSLVLYAATSKGAYKSTDAGSTWQVTVDGYCTQVVLSPTDRRNVVVLGQETVNSSTDAGATWVTHRRPWSGYDDYFTRLAINPREPRTIYAGTTRRGVLRSTDSGATWETVNSGFPRSPYPQLAYYAGVRDIRIGADGTIWAGTFANGLQSLTPVDALFVPRVAHERQQQWTGIALANRGSQTRTVQITLLNPEGRPVWGIRNPVPVELRPGEQKTLLTEDLYPFFPEMSGWWRIDGTGNEVTAFFSTLSPDLEVFDTASADSATGDQFVFPNLVPGGKTQFWIVNPGPTETEVWFELKDSAGYLKHPVVRRTIVDQGVLVQTVEEIFRNVQVTQSDYVEFRTDEPVVGLAYLEDSSRFVSLLPAQAIADASSLLFAPQFADGPAVTTSVSLMSVDPDPGTVRVRWIDDGGEIIGRERDVTLTPYGTVQIDSASFFGLPPGSGRSGYLQIASAWVRLTGSVRFRDPDGEKFASMLPLVHEGRRSLVFSHLISTSDFFTGLAIVNPGEQAAELTLEVLRADGSVLATKQEQLSAHQRLSRLLTEYFPQLKGQSLTSGTIRIASDQEVAAFALFGPYSLHSLAAIPAQ